jgi:hypothetical protein
MARRRLPKPPTLNAQIKAFYTETDGRQYGKLNTSEHPPTIFSNVRWLVEQELAGARHEARGEGAPPKLVRAIAATNWLERAGVKLSDAPGSRCVKELMRFLEDYAARASSGEPRPVSRSTAETLAGTLLAYADAIKSSG